LDEALSTIPRLPTLTNAPPREVVPPVSTGSPAQNGEAQVQSTTAVAPTTDGFPRNTNETPGQKQAETKIGLRILLFIGLLGGIGGGAFYWWRWRAPPLPAGIVWSNGRVDAEEIDIDTKFPGRVLELLVEEGDMVKEGQIIARMDTRDLEVGTKRDEALVRQNEHAVDEAQANVGQLQTQLTLAQQQLNRTSALLKKGFATHELYDQRVQIFNGTKQSLAAAKAHLVETTHALDASRHNVQLDKVNVADNTLVAPRAGRLQYRIAEPGEVLPAGGKVFTMLDIGDVYMNIYLPTLDAGRVKIGADARILLDAYPDIPIRAKVTFLAAQAQFTPKAVETKSERDKLMFRVKVRIDSDILTKYAESLRTGLPGNAYVRVDPAIEWPKWLQGSARQ
jgi:HlyD family secretion protein